jgi:radical SAM protein with 4Fe4S-binding SPASM domain
MVDCEVPIGSSDALKLRMLDNAAHNRLPLHVQFEVTSRCNFACQHCYVNQPMASKKARRSELTTEEVYRLLDEMAESSILWLNFTGGDPFVRSDFMDIYRYANNKGFIISIFTNGARITPEIVDMLAEFPPAGNIEITLYGTTPETYETLTRVPDAFDQVMRGIELIKERNLSLRVKTVITRVNVHEFDEILKFAESLTPGHVVRRDLRMNLRVDDEGSELIKSIRLSPREVFDKSVDTFREEYLEQIKSEESRLRMERERGLLYKCGGGLTSCYVTSTGIMNICSISQIPAYDWRQGDFLSGFRAVHETRLSAVRVKRVQCDTCPLINICDSCPAINYLETGDHDVPSEFYCELTHRQALELGWIDHLPARFLEPDEVDVA